MNYRSSIACLFLLFAFKSYAQNTGNCISIEGILINACSPEEGLNEQALFTTGNTPLNLADLQVSWPNQTNTWQGTCQNANTAGLVAEMSANLGSCGTLLEPSNGIIPANQQVLLFSGISPSVSGLSFVGLSDTLYVLFHCGTTTTGNFSNSGANPRTLTMAVNGSVNCADTVTYIPDQAPAQDGAAALFDEQGNVDYSVIGCSFFTTPISAEWTAPSVLCTSANPINLYDFVTGNPFGTFSGQGVTNGIFDPEGLSGNAVISYVVGSGSCIVENQQTISIQQSGDPSWTNPGAICDQFSPINFNNYITGTQGGTWSGNGLAGPILFPDGINGPVVVTYTVGSGSCISSLSQTLYIGSSLPPITVQGGTNQQICNSSTQTPTITANGYQSTAVEWFSDPAFINLIATGNVYNPTLGVNTTVYVVQTYEGCNVSSATVTINFIDQPAPPVVSPSQVNFCPGSPLPLLTASSTNSTIVWFNDQALTQTLGSGATFQPTEAQAPDIWVVTGPATCRSAATQVVLNGQQLSAAWTAPASICSGAEVLDLSQLITGDIGGTFSGNGVSGTGFNPSGLSGNIVITYQVGSGSCIVESQQTINVLQGGDPSWTSPGSLCNPIDPIVLNDFITGTTGGAWSGAGVAGGVFFPDGLNGPIEITYSVGNGQCASALAQTITIISSVNAPTVPTSVTFCQGQVALPINAGVAPGATVTWYSDATLNTLIFEGNGFVPPANISATYYVTQNVAACASSASSIEVEFAPAPAAPTTQTNVVYCQGQAIPALNATATGTITWYNDAGLTQVLGTGDTYQPDNTVGTDIFVQTVEGNCASEAVEITLTEAPTVTADIVYNGSSTTCNFEPVVLNSPSSSGNLWSTGETTQSITIDEAGTYTLTVTGTCNTASAEVTFIDNGVDATFTLTTSEGLAPLTTTAVNTSSNADNSVFYLNGISGNVNDNLPFTLEDEGEYTLTLISSNNEGCIDSTSRIITVISGVLEVAIPNSFTPNGDGFNDAFKPVLKGLEEMNLIIFNRYGSQVASWKEGLVSWDGNHNGKTSPDGVYFYVLMGKDYSGNEIERSGSITIIR
jgi:gliding motility-associated-like protein